MTERSPDQRPAPHSSVADAASPDPARARPSVDAIRDVSLFQGMAEPDLERLLGMAEIVTVEAGDVVIREGQSGDAMYAILEGELEVTRREGGRELSLANARAGEFIGELALLEDSPRSASVRAVEKTRLLAISRAAFQALLSYSPSAPHTLLRTVTARLRSTEALLMEQQRLVALGTLAAGLAHELNNPAAALRRSTSQLATVLGAIARVAARLAGFDLPAGPPDSAGQAPSDPVGRSDREAGVEEWLADNGVEIAADAAEALVALGWSAESLQAFVARAPAGQKDATVQWLALDATARSLLDEAARSAAAMSELVAAMRDYSYLDRGSVQSVDVRESLEATLVILRHRLKHGIRVVRDFPHEVPRIEAYGTELNGVWTNLLVNAIDALNGSGEIVVRVRERGGEVVVQIQDDGPGIPPEVASRIFEPFYTTKAPGAGTGLGLHIAYNTVTRHHGTLRHLPRPEGGTCFEVRLPMRRP